jgi:molybdopterin converting factor small subunit
MAELHFPSTLAPLFPGFERRVAVEATSVDDAFVKLEQRWPGLRDRLCQKRELRPHIHVYVDRERATLETPLESRSRVDVIAAISGG